MLRTFTIKSREYLTLALVAFILAACAGVAVWQLGAIERGARDVDRGSRSAGAIARFAVQLGGLVQQSPAGQDVTRWNEAYASLVKSLDAVEAAHGERLVAPVRSALDTYQREFASLQAKLQPGVPAVDPAGPDGDGLRASLTQLDTRVEALLDGAAASVDAGSTAISTGVGRTYLGVFVALALALVVAFVALRYMVFGPVVEEAEQLATLCESVARGDLSNRVNAPSDTELGRVGRAVNTVLDNTVPLVDSRQERDRMQAAVMKLLAEVSGVAEGDLTVQAEVTEDVTGAVADSFNLMIGQLRQIIGQVQNASRQISTAVAELRDVTENLASGSDDQAAQAVEASVAIEEMAASIHYVSENASSSAAVAEQARTNAEHGTRAVTRTIEGMKAVRDQVQETAKRIKRLGESSQEIGEIVELIGDIGDRTSILALNASIQAAMAGEAGRGFAIVADEVERLADRATEATKRASMLVKATQGETAEVMTAMEDTTREVINRSNIANEAGVALGEIQGVSNRLAELLQAISDAAQQQARGSEQVAKSMNEMSAVTRNTASGTKQTAAAINSLGGLVDNLNAIVTRFKLPPAGADAPASFTQPRLVASR
jgi:methyl-accepting chemotaxis protein